MEKDKYQHGFSKDHADEMYDIKKRTQKAKKTLSIIIDYLEKEKKNPKKLKLLDIGCSTGFMTRLYGEKFMAVIGILWLAPIFFQMIPKSKDGANTVVPKL